MSTDHKRRIGQLPLGSRVTLHREARPPIPGCRLVGYLPGSSYCHLTDPDGGTLLAPKRDVWPA